MIHYLIIDDEPLAHDLIRNFCDRLPHLKLDKQCFDALEALEFLSNNEVDLIFLDLNMPKLKGFEFLRTLQNPPKVIVTTAYKEHALEGFELAIEDYLVKPFGFERFLKAVNKATKESTNRSLDSLENEATKDHFFAKGEKKYHRIDLKSLLYIEAYGNYSKLFLKSGMLIVHEKISELESLLANDKFLRSHRSFIVALDKIESIQGNLISIKDHEIPIGQTYASLVQKRIFGR